MQPFDDQGGVTIYCGDVLEVLPQLPAESVHCVVTSPPYWALRDYGLPPTIWGGLPTCEHHWGEMIPGSNRGGSGTPTDKNNRGENYARACERRQWCQRCGAWQGCLGLEPSPELYVEHLVMVCRHLRRVLRSDGTLWLNLGDSYANDGKWGGSTGGKHVEALHGNGGPGRAKRDSGLKPKDLVGIPWRVAFALQADGWYLRQDIVWSKVNCMPEPAEDRCVKSHEYIFLLTKEARYFFDYVAIQEDAICDRKRGTHDYSHVPGGGDNSGLSHGEYTRRNKRSVWEVITNGYPEAHFATFPEELIKPCILAGTSAKGCCAQCGAPWERLLERESRQEQQSWSGAGRENGCIAGGGHFERTGQWSTETRTLGWQPACGCGTGDVLPCTVLDPFGGSGTLAKVARDLGCRALSIELRREYCQMHLGRLQQQMLTLSV